jgi:hypothetical protein
MKREQFFFMTWVFGVSLATACGGSATAFSPDSGTSDASRAGSSGSSSGSGSGSSGGSGSGSGSSSGSASDDGGTAIGDCPPNCHKNGCCLTMASGQVLGTCAASAAACGAGFIECAAADECMMGTSCCVIIATGGMPSSTACMPSCPAGSPFACGHGGAADNKDCPGGPAGWTCDPIPGTPSTIFNQCTPAATDGGAPPESGSPETGTPDASGPTDGSSGG